MPDLTDTEALEAQLWRGLLSGDDEPPPLESAVQRLQRTLHRLRQTQARGAQTWPTELPDALERVVLRLAAIERGSGHEFASSRGVTEMMAAVALQYGGRRLHDPTAGACLLLARCLRRNDGTGGLQVTGSELSTPAHRLGRLVLQASGVAPDQLAQADGLRHVPGAEAGLVLCHLPTVLRCVTKVAAQASPLQVPWHG